MFKDVEKMCKEKGIEIFFSKDIEPDKLNFLWYNGKIISLKKDNVEITIHIIGDVSFSILDEDFEIIFNYNNRTDGPALENDDLIEIIEDDEVLSEMIELDRIKWYYNNWSEIFISKDGKQVKHITDSDSTSLTDVFEDFQYYIDLFNEV